MPAVIVIKVKTVAKSGYYGIEISFPYIIRNLKTQNRFLVAGALEVKINTVVLFDLTREACSPLVLKHTTSILNITLIFNCPP